MPEAENGTSRSEFKRKAVTTLGAIALLLVSVYWAMKDLPTSTIINEDEGLRSRNRGVAVAAENGDSQISTELPAVPPEYQAGRWGDCIHRIDGNDPNRDTAWEALHADGVPTNTIQGRPILIQRVDRTTGEYQYIMAPTLTASIYLYLQDNDHLCPLLETPR